MKPPIDTAAQNVTPPPVMIEHVSLPVPPKHHVYLPIPDDLPIRAITGEGIQGLCRIDSGNLVDEFGGAMHEVLSEVRRLGRKGKLSLSLVIAPGGADSLSIEYDVNPKPPKEKRNPFPRQRTVTLAGSPWPGGVSSSRDVSPTTTGVSYLRSADMGRISHRPAFFFSSSLPSALCPLL